jgi:hypothetical protein
MVQLLLQTDLQTDKNSRNSALRAAELNGHEAGCQLLYTKIKEGDTNDLTDAVVAAAEGGHLKAVVTLLHHGADAIQSNDDLPAIFCALLNEHMSMFYCLIDHGATVPPLSIRNSFIEGAGKDGLDSMLQHLAP